MKKFHTPENFPTFPPLKKVMVHPFADFLELTPTHSPDLISHKFNAHKQYLHLDQIS